MGIDWSNLGPGLAVWGDVFRDMAERKKERERQEKMAQTIGQIMHLTDVAKTGEDTTPGVPTMMGTNKIDTSPLIESSINSMYRNLPPNMQAEMGMALHSTKQNLLDKSNETQFLRQAHEQTGKMLQENPLLQEMYGNMYKMIDPVENREMNKYLWQQVNKAKTAPAMAKWEAKTKAEMMGSDYFKTIREIQRKYGAEDRMTYKAIDHYYWKIQQGERDRVKNAENLVNAWSDIATDRRGVASDAHKKYLKELDKFKEFQIDEETIGEIKPLLEEAFTVKSAKVNKKQEKIEITGHELLSSFRDVWENFGKPGIPNQSLVDMAVQNLIEEKAGESFDPVTGMNDFYDFVYDKMGIENMATAFRVQDYFDKESQVEQLKRMALVEEIMSFQRQAIARDIALNAGETGVAAKIKNEMQTPSDWRYLDVSTYSFEEGKPETQSIRVKPQYRDDAKALTEYLSNPESGRVIDVMTNALNLPVDMAMAIRLLGDPGERGILTDIEREPQPGVFDKLYEKKLRFSNYIGKSGEEVSEMFSGIGQSIGEAKEKVKKAVTDIPSEEEAIESIERQAEAGRTGGQGEIKRGLEAKTTPEAIKQIKNMFTKELAHMDADIVNAPALKKTIRWQYPDEKGGVETRKKTLNPDDKIEYIATIEEMLTDEANKVYGINIGRVNLNDPALKEVKDYVEDIWSRMW